MENLPTAFLSTAGGSLLLSLLLTPLVRWVAIARGYVAVPKATRWHRRVTALLGGAAIYLSTVLSWLIFARLTDWERYGGPFLPLMLCATAVFVLGLVDDLLTMAPQHKLAGQLIIAATLLFFGYRLDWTPWETANLLLSLLWIVGITNAFNLLDNMDGLAAGVAFVAGTFLCLFLWPPPAQGGPLPSLLMPLAAYLGAVLGFLVYNFNPASIFMGDAGSLFIGFFMASLSLQGAPDAARTEGPLHRLALHAVPVLILFVPILDTAFVSFMRPLFRRKISQGGRDHSSHRLVAAGLSERRAVLLLYGFSAASGLMALALSRMRPGLAGLIVTLYLLFVFLFWLSLGKIKVYKEKSILTEENSSGLTPVLVEITYRRRLLEVFLDVALITVAYYTGYLLRFEGDLGANFDFFLMSLPLVIACQILCFYLAGVYRGVWESTSLADLLGYLRGITAGTILPILILLFAYRFYSFSRAVFVIYWGVLLILVSLSRLSFRLFEEGIRKKAVRGRPALIYGAGVGGQMVLREIESNADLDLHPVGFLDDNPRLKHRRIRGYPVLGGGEDLESVIQKRQVREVIVSFREGASQKKKEIRDRCEALGGGIRVTELRLSLS